MSALANSGRSDQSEIKKMTGGFRPNSGTSKDCEIHDESWQFVDYGDFNLSGIPTYLASGLSIFLPVVISASLKPILRT